MKQIINLSSFNGFYIKNYNEIFNLFKDLSLQPRFICLHKNDITVTYTLQVYKSISILISREKCDIIFVKEFKNWAETLISLHQEGYEIYADLETSHFINELEKEFKNDKNLLLFEEVSKETISSLLKDYNFQNIGCVYKNIPCIFISNGSLVDKNFNVILDFHDNIDYKYNVLDLNDIIKDFLMNDKNISQVVYFDNEYEKKDYIYL